MAVFCLYLTNGCEFLSYLFRFEFLGAFYIPIVLGFEKFRRKKKFAQNSEISEIFEKFWKKNLISKPSTMGM